MTGKTEQMLLNLQFPYQDTWDVSQNHLTLELKNVDLSFVNSLRRLVLSNIPAVSFNVRPIETSQMTIYKNNTPFENEFISHRMGLIPIHLNADTFDPADYSFVINKENPTKDFMEVTSEDIQIIKLSENRTLSKEQTRKIFPGDSLSGGFIQITKIYPWEDKTMDKPAFHCEGKAIVSNALNNASFKQTSAVAHSFKIDPVLYQKKFEQYIKDQHLEHNRINKILKDFDPEFEEEALKKSETEFKKKFDLLEAERCFYQNEDGDPYWFNMLIESIGIYSPIMLFEKAIEILISKVNNFKGLLETPIDGQLEVTKGYNGMDRAYCIRIYNENETLGNLISAHLMKYYVVQNPQLSAVGFNRAHPLEKSVMLYLNPMKDKSTDWGINRDYIFETCDQIVKMAKDLLVELQNHHLYKTKVALSKKSKK